MCRPPVSSEQVLQGSSIFDGLMIEWTAWHGSLSQRSHSTPQHSLAHPHNRTSSAAAYRHHSHGAMPTPGGAVMWQVSHSLSEYYQHPADKLTSLGA